MLFPKPKSKRRVPRTKSNPMVDINDVCEICGRPYAHLHEIFFGPNRQKSILYRLQIRLCQECHEGNDGPHMNREVDLKYKREAQCKFEARYGHELFMMEFGRNYLCS